MYINILFYIVILSPCVAYLCNYELNQTSGTIVLSSYDNNIECTWTFYTPATSYNVNFRSLLLTFHHFDTEFGHDELLIGETIDDVSKYNSKLFRFSGSKIPDPCLIPLRGDILTRLIWIQFTSDQTNTGSGFIIDYTFLVNQTKVTTSRSQETVIDADIVHPLEYKSHKSKTTYPYPYGTISTPNYPQNYSNNIICRWHFYHRNAFIRLYIHEFQTELHYDTLTFYLGQNLNNRAMILHELSGNIVENKHLFIRNDNLFLVFNTDKSHNATGFSLNYEIIEKDTHIFNVYDNQGIIYSKDYPRFSRTNIEHKWIIHMNSSNEIEINLIDISLDYDYDCLKIITGDIVYPVNSPESVRIHTQNETMIILRTTHSNDDYQYRGFNLTYKKLNRTFQKEDEEEQEEEEHNLPCGKKYTSANGTIEFQIETKHSLDCLILIDIDDGQNIFLRFDYLNWDRNENYIDIGLFHDPAQNQIYHISDAIPGTWFIASNSQLWIRFIASQFSLGLAMFRLSYSETIEWSTTTPEPYVQILDDNRLFPYQFISLATNGIYHNLTQANVWQVIAIDDESIRIIFQSLQVYDDRRICFSVKDLFKTTQICNHERFPFVYHHVGSCTISIEPEFIWILVEYRIQIEKFKKITNIINNITFESDYLTLTPPITLDSFLHIEWIISLNLTSTIIIDIENVDDKTGAELIIYENKNITKTFLLDKIKLKRFSHVLFSIKSPFRIMYKSLSLPMNNRKRLFRLHLHRASKAYLNFGDLYYIYKKQNESKSKWTIDGKYWNSTFLGSLFSLNRNVSLQTTANVNLTVQKQAAYISSSNFDIRYQPKKKLPNSDFIIILYEQQESNSYQNIFLNKYSDVLETNNFSVYYIYLESRFSSLIDFIIVNADYGTQIRLYDLNIDNGGHFQLNSSRIISKGTSSLIGLRFTIRSLNIKIELQSLTRTPIKLRYRLRTSFIQGENLHDCSIIDANIYTNNSNQTYNEFCFHWFDHISTSMNNTRINNLWPYGYRGSVTLIIENTTIENFEKTIYRALRQSIAKIIRKFCFNYHQRCSSEDTDSIRTDHVIIQSYEEQLDNDHLYVSIFIKDPYRQTVALTNDQFLLALKHSQYEIYQDIKHHINLPSNLLEQTSLDSIWLYGVCLLALVVLIVVLLMLITIFMRKTPPTAAKHRRTNKPTKTIPNKETNLLLSYPVRLAVPEDEHNISSCFNETLSSQTSNSMFTTSLSPVPASYYHFPTAGPSYFNSNIETVIKEHLHDEEPIPFIDDNLSTTQSRKSSTCWSDKTSLSSRFSLAWKLNKMRLTSNGRSILSYEKEKRRHPHRTVRYAQPPVQDN